MVGPVRGTARYGVDRTALQDYYRVDRTAFLSDLPDLADAAGFSLLARPLLRAPKHFMVYPAASENSGKSENQRCFVTNTDGDPATA